MAAVTLPSDKDAILNDLLSTVNQYGWTHFQVPAKEGTPLFGFGKAPPWSYTIGLFQSYKHPEIVIVGEDDQLASRVLQDTVEQIKAGEVLEHGKEYREFIPRHNRTFLLMSKSHFRRYLEWAIRFYGSTEFPALQMVWSDQQGLYPWDRGSEFETRLKDYQPLLSAR